MISEKFFIKTYNSFWQNLMPSGSDYIKIINSTLCIDTFDKLDLPDHPNRRGLINSIAFSLFSKICSNHSKFDKIQDILSNKAVFDKIVLQEKEILSNLRYGKRLSVTIEKTELQIIEELSNRLIKRYKDKKDLLISPRFSGCGVLFEVRGDVYYMNTLVEIKAGERGFSIHDLRQLYVYLTLNHIGGNYAISEIELFNPRTGLLWKEYIDEVSENIAGMSTIEIIQEILHFISYDIRSN